MNKRVTSLAIAASLIAGTGVGAALTPMAALAADSNVTSTDTAKRTPAQWLTDALQGLVDKGTITQEQSAAIATAVEAAKPPMHIKHGFGGPGLDKAAEVLGISVDDLHTALDGNKSLADVAKDKNVDVQKVIDALVADEKTKLDQGVTAGELTQAEADAAKADVVQRVTDMVNNARPDAPGRPAGPDFRPMKGQPPQVETGTGVAPMALS